MSNVVPLNPPKTEEQPTVPDFITRQDIMKMSDKDLDELVDAIRNRREANHAYHAMVVRGVKDLSEEKIAAQIEKRSDYIIKQLSKIDDAIEKIEKYVNEIRGYRIQGGMEIV